MLTHLIQIGEKEMKSEILKNNYKMESSDKTGLDSYKVNQEKTFKF